MWSWLLSGIGRIVADTVYLPENRPSGGADKILQRAIKLQESGQHQLACELADVVIAANPKEKTARMIKASSLDYIGVQSGNLNTFGFYRSAAAQERQWAGIRP